MLNRTAIRSRHVSVVLTRSGGSLAAGRHIHRGEVVAQVHTDSDLPYDGLPGASGLYHPSMEHDACGVGFIADINGTPTHTTVVQALEAVERLDHRGARGADPKTGDGVGMLTQLPHRFFQKYLRSKGIHVRNDKDLAVGVLFLPSLSHQLVKSGAVRVNALLQACEEEFHRLGLEVLAWRNVPVGEYSLGDTSLATLPDIRQVMLRRPSLLEQDSDAFERLLYVARKRIEARVNAARKEIARQEGWQLSNETDQVDPLPFYVSSLSHRTIVYKGLVIARNLPMLYPDLNDSDFQSAVALFHQRYSTNTFPRWFTAQPFRMLAHNGEINTIQGNMNWMKMREEALHSPLFRGHFQDLLPVIPMEGSDSAALDNVMEMLVQCGRDPVHAASLMVPEAHEQNSTIHPDVRAFYDYNRTLMEPWDGPTALCFTDGRIAAASLDRNGLRPLRYWITGSGKVIMGSEVGIVSVPVEDIVERGRLGPGEMFAVDMEAGQVLRNKELKLAMASRRPYSAWLERSLNLVGSSASVQKGLGQILSAETLMRLMGPIQAQERLAKYASEESKRDGSEDAILKAVQEEVDERVRFQKAFGYHKEDEERILSRMAETGHEPIGSMGDDTPLAAFSPKPQPVYRYFKQRFAEVTNPPIDPLLERPVMSLNITFGRKGMLLEETQNASFLVRFPSPVVTESQLRWLTHHPEFQTSVIPTVFPAAEGARGLEAALDTICEEAQAAVDNGASFLLLSDRAVGPSMAPVPALLAVGAVQHSLIRAGKRMRASILVESAEPREDHHIACLLGYGASVVHPYLAFEMVAEKAAKDVHLADKKDAAAQSVGGRSVSHSTAHVEGALSRYRKGLEDGLLRIMSKMGISTVDSYRGAQVFEILGLSRDVVDKCFAGTTPRLPAATLESIGNDVLELHRRGYGEPVVYKRGTALPRSGMYAQVKDGEFHAFNLKVFNKLRAVASKTEPGEKGYSQYLNYAEETDGRPLTSVRDALRMRPAGEPIPLEEVEDVTEIVRRFSTQAMSHGSVSREVHETLAIAANRLGSRSNTGEGGEDPRRYVPYAKDDPSMSYSKDWYPRKGDQPGHRIKQVASARFGVTPAYLVNAEQLEIKMAQGSKPGEGGHIPGHKVNAEIAAARHSNPGITLVSPPPHHDIYSIEDLKQLIYDLKRVNDRAEVIVKLVAQSGVGTIAAGVVKGHADVIQISGGDGGTGASPLGSVKYAGLPWELGLVETQQVLLQNDLRSRVRLRVDGGLKTGQDVVMAALMGAEEFGFGTASLVALGCVMARKCHLNTCPVGIATQDPEYRAKYKGAPEHVVTFLLHTAEQVRHTLAELGLRSLDEAVGRIDLLEPRTEDADGKTLLFPKGQMDFSDMLYSADPSHTRDQRCTRPMGLRIDPDAAAAGMPVPSVHSAPQNAAQMVTMQRPVLDDVVLNTCRPYLDAIIDGTAPLFDLSQVEGRADLQAEAKRAGQMGQAPVELHFPIVNEDRTVGARLSGEIARRTGVRGLPDGSLQLHFHGIAGQSFGAFNNRGMHLTLRGEAHDGVGKSMYGGTIALSLSADAAPPQPLQKQAEEKKPSMSASQRRRAMRFSPASSAAGGWDWSALGIGGGSVICGNATLYGATGGRLFAAGMAGERFGVRNSGAEAVVEGVGDHCCEYMIRGCVVVLGPVGRNFGAGMSGGEAFVLDLQDELLDRYNDGMVEPKRIVLGDESEQRLRSLIEAHVAHTGSSVGERVLEWWEAMLPRFWHVVPNPQPAGSQSQALMHVPQWSARGNVLMAATPVPTVEALQRNFEPSPAVGHDGAEDEAEHATQQ